MNITDKALKPCRGEIEVFRRYKGYDKTLLRKDNLVVNSGMDLLAQALAGDKFVNGMYMAYSNDTPPIAEPSPQLTDTVGLYQGAGSVDPKGFVRVPTIANPAFSSSDVQYNTNKVTFVGISDGQVAIPNGGNSVQDGVSQFYGAGLVHLDPDDLADDILFASVTFGDFGPSEFEQIAGAQIGIRWSVYFEI
jgi:hypothetical protein